MSVYARTCRVLCAARPGSSLMPLNRGPRRVQANAKKATTFTSEQTHPQAVVSGTTSPLWTQGLCPQPTQYTHSQCWFNVIPLKTGGPAMPRTARAWYPYIRLVFLFFCVGPSVIVGDLTVHTHLRRTVWMSRPMTPVKERS